jgi:hypothetical protein
VLLDLADRRAGGLYDGAVDSALNGLINGELAARPKADTKAVLAKIRNNWFKATFAPPSLGLLRRNFDGVPWMAGMPHDAPESLPWLSPNVFGPLYGEFSFVIRDSVDGKIGVTLANMGATTRAIRAKFVAAHPGMDRP